MKKGQLSVGAALTTSVVLAVSATAAAEPFEHGNAPVIDVEVTCGTETVLVTTTPGAAFDDQGPRVVQKVVWYAADGATVIDEFALGSFDTLDERGELTQCSYTSPFTDLPADVWVFIPHA